MVQNCILNLNFVNIFLQNIEEYVVLQGQAIFLRIFVSNVLCMFLKILVVAKIEKIVGDN